MDSPYPVGRNTNKSLPQANNSIASSCFGFNVSMLISQLLEEQQQIPWHFF